MSDVSSSLCLTADSPHIIANLDQRSVILGTGRRGGFPRKASGSKICVSQGHYQRWSSYEARSVADGRRERGVRASLAKECPGRKEVRPPYELSLE